MANMSNVLGMVFADVHDITISELTKLRTMGSVPFGGRYRLIDFPLSNMVNSGITEVGVVTKANYQSLMDHIGGGGEYDLARKNGGLHVLPPYSHIGGGLYRGRLEALAWNEDFIRHSDAEYVVLADCDVVANMDYKKIIDAHEQSGADITVVYGKKYMTAEQAKTKTIFSINDNNEVYDVLIRPEISGEQNAGLNIFVMGKKFLLNLLKETASRNLYRFEADILQGHLKEYKICGYKFDKYYAQIDSIDSYYKSNMELMDLEKRNILFNQDAPIYTKVRDEAPAKYGIEAIVRNSLIPDGCVIEGTVENSVLFRGVKVGKGAIVKDCILMQDTVVGDKAEMSYVITDKDVTVTDYRTVSGTETYPVFIGKRASV